jgi:general secretion pathway protein F
MKIEYRAINAEGAIVTGVLEVEDQRKAARQLSRQGLTPVSLHAPEHAPVQIAYRRGRVNERDLLILLKQLTTLLKSGVSLDEAIASLAESESKPQLKRELIEISTQIRRGHALSQAFKGGGLKLPSYIHHLTEAGELTGNLTGALSDGLAQMEYEQQVNSELKNALIYPSILIVSGIGAVLLIFTLVVPKFTKLLEKSRGDVPILAQIVLKTGQFMNDNILALSSLLAIMTLLILTALAKAEIRQRLWDLLMRLPLIGPWLIEADIGRWSSMLATLLGSRVELTRALELAQQGVSGSRLRSNLTQVTKAVRGGNSLAESLQQSGAITATGYGLVRVGERSGELPVMVHSLATLYTESGRNRMKRFLTLLEPIAILTIGGVIGVIMTGIILAITSVNEISI